MKRSRRLSVAMAWVLGVAAAALAGGCEKSPAATGGGPAAGGPRIVSLSPALTRTLADLGLGDAIVGRTPFCRGVPSDVPTVGDLYDLDYERLVRLRPTHVVVQPPGGRVDPALERLAEANGWCLAAWRLDTVQDIERLLAEMPGALFEDEPVVRAAVEARARARQTELAAALRPPTGPSWTGPVLLVYSIEPVGIFGSGTYLHDVAERLGATGAAGIEGWAELTVEDVVRADPPAIILVRPELIESDPVRPDPAQPGQSEIDPLVAAGPLGRLDIEAVRTGRVGVLHHPDALLPSSGLTGVATELKRLLAAFAAASPDGPAP